MNNTLLVFINLLFTNLKVFLICVSFARRHITAIGPKFDSAISVIVKNIENDAVRCFENVMI